MNIQAKYKSLSNIEFYPQSINIPDNFSGIKNIWEFRNKFQNKNWNLAPQYIRTFNFFSRIQEQVSNWVDPIEYLYYLYFEIKLSTLDIHSELWILWNYENDWSIWKMLKNVLLWNIRVPNHKDTQTNLRKEKDQNKVKKVNTVQKIIKQDNIKNVENIINRISKNKQKNDFSEEIFSNLKNIKNKAKYILDINWYINSNDFTENLIKLSDKYGMKVTAQAITNILEKETDKIWNIDKINLRAWRIREIKDEQI